MIYDSDFYYFKDDVLIQATNSNKKFIITSETENMPIEVGYGVFLIVQQLNGLNNVRQLISFTEKTFNIANETAKQKIYKIIRLLAPYLLCKQNPDKVSVCPKIINIENNSESLPISPMNLTFSITDYCNRNCIYCFANAIYTKKEIVKNTFLTVERFKTIISEAKSLGVNSIDITGGEPLLNQDILKYIKILSDSNIHFLLSTKKYISKDVAKDLYNNGLKTIQVSLDSCKEEIADLLIGEEGAFKEILDTIENLQQAGIEVSINCVLTKLNINEMHEFICFLYSKNIFKISFNIYGETCGRRDISLLPTDEQLMIAKKNYDINRDFYDKKKIRVSCPFAKDVQMIINKNGELKKHYKGICEASKYRLNINSFGYAVFCGYMNDEKALYIGNLNTCSLMDIWTSKARKKLINYENIDMFEGTPCYSCERFKECGKFRCYMRALMEYGTPFSKDPLCRI